MDLGALVVRTGLILTKQDVVKLGDGAFCETNLHIKLLKQKGCLEMSVVAS